MTIAQLGLHLLCGAVLLYALWRYLRQRRSYVFTAIPRVPPLSGEDFKGRSAVDVLPPDCPRVPLPEHVRRRFGLPSVRSSVTLLPGAPSLQEYCANHRPGVEASDARTWAYLSLMGADNSLGHTAPTSPEPPYNFAGDSLLWDLLYHYGGDGRGSNRNVHMVCLATDLNPVTNMKLESGLFFGEGVEGHYRAQENESVYSGQTGFSQGGVLNRFDSSNPRTLQNFVEMATARFPSKHRCVILWGHAYAWGPDALLEDRGVLKGTDDPFFMPIEADPYYQGRSKDSLQSALEAAGGVDVLAFDTCMGMGIENLYLLRHATRYLVGNCDYTGWKGINHREVGDVLRAHDDLSPWALAKTIVDHFAPQLDGTLNFAISAQGTSRAVRIRTALCELAQALVNFLNMDGLREQNTALVLQARAQIVWANYSTGEGGNGGVDALFADAGRICLELAALPDPTAAVPKRAQGLLDVLLDGTESYRHCTGSFEGLSGMNLFFPSNLVSYLEPCSTPDQTPYATVYAKLSFNTDAITGNEHPACSWSDFLSVLFGA